MSLNRFDLMNFLEIQILDLNLTVKPTRNWSTPETKQSLV